MAAPFTPNEEAQLEQTIEMFEVITQSQPQDYQSLEILKEAYFKLGREKEIVATSKRIAQAYVQFGQLSSAILEYESILQRFPDDPDVRAALAEIETKANNLASPPAPILEIELAEKVKPGPSRTASAQTKAPSAAIDDGRQMMHKVFVESKAILSSDFDLLWPTPDMSEVAGHVREPFVQILADQGVLPLEESLKLLCEKSRGAYLPLDKYDIDVELARGFPRETCLRWCVLPFDRMSKSILVATANPFNKQAALELEQAAGSRLLWYVTQPPELLKVLKKIFR
jgi:tetratricopeptide (TPR) repeat protein